MLIVLLAEQLGATSIKDLPGAWFHQIDDKWAVAANGKKETQHCGPQGGMDIDLPFGHFAVWRNGWLFAMLTPFGGTFMGPEGSGENEFSEMMQKLLKK